MQEESPLDHPDALADLLVILANCLRDPDEDVIAAVDDGKVGSAVEDAVAETTLTLDTDTDPPVPSSVGEATESSRALFEALETPYAPPAESPYKPWYDGRTGLMNGPPAEELARLYETLGLSFPSEYSPDHVALILECGALLLETGRTTEFTELVDRHLDWIPAFRMAVDGASADAPFYRWAVHLLDDVSLALRSRLDIEPVEETTARTMVDRVDDAAIAALQAR